MKSHVVKRIGNGRGRGGDKKTSSPDCAGGTKITMQEQNQKKKGRKVEATKGRQFK